MKVQATAIKKKIKVAFPVVKKLPVLLIGNNSVINKIKIGEYIIFKFSLIFLYFKIILKNIVVTNIKKNNNTIKPVSLRISK